MKSFRRKYPDCPRRNVDMDERDFLREMKIVNETQADLGLTAIPSSAVLDIMCQVDIVDGKPRMAKGKEIVIVSTYSLNLSLI